jgi:hypothetical protein
MAWNGFHFNLHLGFGLSQSTIMEIKFGFLTPQSAIYGHHFPLLKHFLHDKNHHWPEKNK